jgi:hypothetical protein
MDAEGKLAQLGQRRHGFVRGSIQAASDGRVAVVTQGVSGDPQLETQRDESLLGAVVEVALDPPALKIPGLDDARARGTDLLELRLDLGGQPVVLNRKPHSAGNRGDQTWLL